MRKAIWILAGSLSLLLWIQAWAQSPVDLNTSTTQEEINYLHALENQAIQNIHNPLFVKIFFTNASPSNNLWDITDKAVFYISNVNHLNLVPANLQGASGAVILNNADIYSKYKKILKTIPKPIYLANKDWLSLNSAYSKLTEYAGIPQYDNAIKLRVCDYSSCNNYVALIYTLDSHELFGYLRLAGVPPQIYLLNVTTLEQRALALSIDSYEVSKTQVGTLNNWISHHPVLETQTQ